MKIKFLQIILLCVLVNAMSISTLSAQHNYKVAFLSAYYSFTSKDSVHTDTIGLSYWSDDTSYVNNQLSKYSSSLTQLIIENASGVLYSIDVSLLPHLQKLILYGNDWCTDRLTFMDDDFLQLPEMKEVVFEGEGLPVEEFNRIKKDYPAIKFSGEICEMK